MADLVQNVGRPDHGWTALYARAMGFYDCLALSRAIRWTGFDDRRAARRALDRILALGFDRLVVGHPVPLSSGAHAALAAAYAWLRPAPLARATASKNDRPEPGWKDRAPCPGPSSAVRPGWRPRADERPQGKDRVGGPVNDGDGNLH